jgi:hypothetical protein
MGPAIFPDHPGEARGDAQSTLRGTFGATVVSESTSPVGGRSSVGQGNLGPPGAGWPDAAPHQQLGAGPDRSVPEAASQRRRRQPPPAVTSGIVGGPVALGATTWRAAPPDQEFAAGPDSAVPDPRRQRRRRQLPPPRARTRPGATITGTTRRRSQQNHGDSRHAKPTAPTEHPDRPSGQPCWVPSL